MAQEDKELLLKDLCARLPYKVKCCIYNFGEDTVRIKEDVLWSVQGDNILTLKSCVEKGEAYMYHQIKPYLFPISIISNRTLEEINAFVDAKTSHVIIEFFNSRHIDYRGLIEKGLAIDATNLSIY